MESTTLDEKATAGGEPAGKESKTTGTLDTRERRGHSERARAIISEIEAGRRTVGRIRELVDGDRGVHEVKHTDWFAVLEYAQDEADEELALYFESHHPDAPSTATVQALDDSGLWVLCAAVSERSGSSTTRVRRWDVEDEFRFSQPGDDAPDFVTVSEAKDRLRAFGDSI